MSGIHPQLAVRRSAEAVEFYTAAFGATERHRADNAAGEVVCQLDVDGRRVLGHILDPYGHRQNGRPTSSSSGTS